MTVEDRLRATTQALSVAMREVRPLTLPEPPERPYRARPPRGPRRWRGWLVPLTAGLAMIAVAVILVAVRVSHDASPTPPTVAPRPAAAAIPRYYVQLGAYKSVSGYQREAIVGDSSSGRVLATVRPPGQLTFAGVTGAADDRTFVLDATSDAVPVPAQGAHSWYLLRLSPGAAHPATLTRLPIGGPADSGQITGLALAPDAATLAILYQAGILGGTPGPYTLRTYSMRTGKALRSWTAPANDRNFSIGGGDLDNEVSLTWTADGRTLAFVYPPNAWPDYERTLNATAKSGRLLAASHPVLAIPGNQDNCGSLLLAADGRTMVCGTAGNATGGCRQQEPQFDLYSTATGKLTRVLYRFRVTCQAAYTELAWAGSDGTAIGAIVEIRASKHDPTPDYAVGLLRAGTFTPLHVPVPAGYGSSTGQLAF
jgi:hypothetical protein